ncbi:MAG: 50S ribosomal protein L15 [Candidatus Gracilibacteria bacterium]|nr:50S ribosomal protein L15 [Candidatus Gracilibacteria bacterium]
MLSLNNLKSSSGSRLKSKRLGRGVGSGKGSHCGRGLNGQNCRAGGGMGPWFEGGQTPLFRRMPKLKGFSNVNFTIKYSVVNVSDLEMLAQKGITEITKEVLLENLLVRNKNFKVKVLGDGEITSKISLKVNKITPSAQDKIIASGGSVELI